MKIQIGSRVKFLNDVGGGTVRGFRDDKIVVVETDDGFEMPVLSTDLVIDEQASYGSDGIETGHNQIHTIKEEIISTEPELTFEEKKHKELTGEVLLAIVPENDKLLHVSKFNLYLVNDSNYYFHYVLSGKDSGISTLIKTGSIEPDTKLDIEEYSQTSIAKVKEIRLQGFFFKHGLMTAEKPIDLTFSIENVSFYKSGYFKENEYFHQRALVLGDEKETDMSKALEQLKESDLSKIATIKESKEPSKKSNSPKNVNIEEVDLHIEEIVENHAEMSNGEIVDIQLSRFETALETAIRGKIQKIAFIHGVGNGKLKYELRKKLDKKYPDLRYQDASFKEYGYGATMVYLK
jgi:hypothetical protein